MRRLIIAALPLGLFFTFNAGVVTSANAGAATLAQPQASEWSARRQSRYYKKSYSSRPTAFAWLFANPVVNSAARPARAVRPARAATGGGSCSGNRIVATWYQSGRRTASGAPFNPDGYTAAHRSLPFGSRVTVTNPRNGQSVAVTINDRGPFTRGVSLDLARGAARSIGMTGTQQVCMS